MWSCGCSFTTFILVHSVPSTQCPVTTFSVTKSLVSLTNQVPRYLGTWVPGYLCTWVPGKTRTFLFAKTRTLFRDNTYTFCVRVIANRKKKYTCYRNLPKKKLSWRTLASQRKKYKLENTKVFIYFLFEKAHKKERFKKRNTPGTPLGTKVLLIVNRTF